MSGRALILTYHAIETGPPPLFLEPSRFGEHLDCLLSSEARPMTLDEIAAGLRGGHLPERAVALTFDDGFLSVVEQAAPLLVERAVPATVFCTAGHLGGHNDWPTQPPSAPRRALAGGRALAELAASGFEIGSHGMHHAPLETADEKTSAREIVSSRILLEEAVGAAVRWFAYPYGSLPGDRARDLIERTYVGACAALSKPVRTGADPYALPRVDAHYLRDPRRLAAALEGRLGYLGLRRLGSRVRRTVVRDWA